MGKTGRGNGEYKQFVYSRIVSKWMQESPGVLGDDLHRLRGLAAGRGTRECGSIENNRYEGIKCCRGRRVWNGWVLVN